VIDNQGWEIAGLRFEQKELSRTDQSQEWCSMRLGKASILKTEELQLGRSLSRAFLLCLGEIVESIP